MIIALLHIVTLYVALYAPFQGTMGMLSAFVVIVPFVMMHWLVDVDDCAFTEMERLVRRCPKSQTVTNMYLKRVYKTGYHPWPVGVSYATLTALWLIALARLWKHPDFAAMRHELRTLFSRNKQHKQHKKHRKK